MSQASEHSPESQKHPKAQATQPPGLLSDPQPDPEPATPALTEPDPGILRAAPALPGVGPLVHRVSHERLNVFVMRHASAGTRRANPRLDVKRPLDKDGKRHCLHLAYVLNSLRVSFDLIVSSPLKRCLQTAQLIGTETGYEARILHAEGLRPEAEYAQFHRLVQECRQYDNVLMVGHNPTLTFFLGQLIAGPAGGVGTDDAGSPARVRLRKGSLARVTLDRSPAVLQWMLDPRLVSALYNTSTKSSRRKTSRK